VADVHGTYTVCPVCQAIVADQDAHRRWHMTLTNQPPPR
jgi:hypothetical protein